MTDNSYQYYLNQKTTASYYLELGNPLKALEHYEKAYATPFGLGDLDLILELAFLHDEMGQTAKAITLFQEMIKLDREFPTPYYGLATIYDNEEDYEKAIYYYQKTIDIDPEYEAAYFFLANIYDELGNTIKAIECYQKTIDIDPTYFYAHINLGCIYEAEDQNLKAYHHFYRAYQIDSANYIGLFNLGVACRKLRQIKESIRYYRKTIAANKIYPHTYLNLALLYKEEYQDYQESINLYTEGIKYNPEFAVLYYNRACCYALLKNEKNALQDLKKALELSPALKDYLKTDAELIHLRQQVEASSTGALTSLNVSETTLE